MHCFRIGFSSARRPARLLVILSVGYIVGTNSNEYDTGPISAPFGARLCKSCVIASTMPPKPLVAGILVLVLLLVLSGDSRYSS